jgi:hypothetical protein
MILKIFSPKISAKKLAFLTQNKAKICEILIITLVFEKNANFFAEHCRKSQKIVIITSTAGWLFYILQCRHNFGGLVVIMLVCITLNSKVMFSLKPEVVNTQLTLHW